MLIKLNTPIAKIVLNITKYNVQSLLTSVTVDARTIDTNLLLPLVEHKIINSFSSGLNNTMNIMFYTKYVTSIEY